MGSCCLRTVGPKNIDRGPPVGFQEANKQLVKQKKPTNPKKIQKERKKKPTKQINKQTTKETNKHTNFEVPTESTGPNDLKRAWLDPFQESHQTFSSRRSAK